MPDDVDDADCDDGCWTCVGVRVEIDWMLLELPAPLFDPDATVPAVSLR